MTKAEIVWVRSLHDKRGRMAAGFFVAEGRKAVEDFVNSGLGIAKIYCIDGYEEAILVAIAAARSDSAPASRHRGAAVVDVEVVSSKDMERISLMKSPSEVVAVVEIPRYDIDMGDLVDKLSLVLDGVQDPGNLGTIIRLADWFGIENVICSPDSADCFNPKVVQATMGAIARVRVHYAPLVPFLELFSGVRTECQDSGCITSASDHAVATSANGSAKASSNVALGSEANCGVMPIYGTFLDGDIIYDSSLTSRGVIVMGSEGRGISSEVEPFITRRLFIPPFPVGVPTSESLNVAVATSIVCSEFRRGLK